MGWAAEVEEEIEEPGAGDGIGSSTITANPGEKVHIDVERIDVGPTEPWRVAIEASTNPGAPRWSNPPIMNRRLLSTQLTPNIVVSGYFAYRVWVENDDGTPTDVVIAKVRYRKDGVDL